MIPNWVEIVGILVVVLAALLGAFWKLLSKAGDNKSKYQQDIEAVRALVVSRDVVPEIIALIEKVETEKELSPGQRLEDILSPAQSTFAHSLRRVVQSSNPVDELERLYLSTIDSNFKCAYDMLAIAILPGITVVWVFVDAYWLYFIPLVLFAGLIMLAKATYDILAYTRTLRRFINKDNEIRLKRSS